MRKLWVLVVTVCSVSSVLAVSPAGAAIPETPPENHCVVEVIGQLKSGEFELSAETCFSDIADAMSAAGLGSGVDTTSEMQSAAAAMSVTIGVHYDGAGFTGASFSVVGGVCNGGWLNVSAAWNNRVSSSLSLVCGRIRHFTGYNLTGSSQDTTPNGNLSSPVNNAVSSIQYLAS